MNTELKNKFRELTKELSSKDIRYIIAIDDSQECDSILALSGSKASLMTALEHCTYKDDEAKKVLAFILYAWSLRNISDEDKNIINKAHRDTCEKFESMKKKIDKLKEQVDKGEVSLFDILKKILS
jgi:hypothetical protein